MCGIYITNHSISKQIIQKKLDLISYRGPDAQKILQKDSISFGHLRLAVLDLDERSNQPMTFDDLTIVYNGEIYNYNDVRKSLEQEGVSFNTRSDTEVVLKGYDAWGKDIVSKLNGMFAFAIFDKKKGQLFCSRDRLGVKPFYYSWKEGFFEICSQIGPISGQKKINSEALNIYLQTGYVPSPYSIYEDVFKLSPGNNLTIDLKKGEKSIEKYWDLNSQKLKTVSYNQAKKELHRLLIDAVKIRLQSDVPYGSFLSGGIDSALVSAIANKVSKEKINTFTIGFDKFEYDESELAQKFSNIIESEHKTIQCSEKEMIALLPKFFEVYDEPFADSSSIPSLLLNKSTKPYVTVALAGDGGDESFLGYNHFSWVQRFKILFWFPLILRRMISRFPFELYFGKKGSLLKDILEITDLNQFIRKIFTGFQSILKEDDLDWFKWYESSLYLSKNPIQKAADLNIKLWLENDSNVKVDRASMAYSVEVRSPFLDYRIIEFARSLPVSYRFSRGKRKKILKDILKNYIPKSVFQVPKKGFSVPIADWIRGPLKEEVINQFSSDTFYKIPNLDTKKMLRYLNIHLENKADYSMYIWRVFVLITWIKKNNIRL